MREEEKLQKVKEHYQRMDIPDAAIDDAIKKGMEQASAQRRLRRSFSSRRIRFNLKWTSTVVAAMILIFVMMIRVSPVFASYVSYIPGLEKFVELVRFDKGLTSAIENEFMQPVGVFDEHEGIKITIDSAIVDEQQMVLFYTMELSDELRDRVIQDMERSSFEAERTAETRFDQLEVGKVQLLDEHGESVMASMQFSSPVPDEERKKGKWVNEMRFYFHEALDSGQYTLQIWVQKHDPQPGIEREFFDSTWIIPIQIDTSKFAGMKETYELNETVTIERQKITFSRMEVFPTRIGIHVKFAEENTHRIFGFDDLELVDDKGEKWGTIVNGVTATMPGENEWIIYFESNYFSRPESLYLQFSSVRALPKDQLQVVVDVENERILKAPKDGRIKKVANTGMGLSFFVKMDDRDEHMYLNIFEHKYRDADGNELESNSAFATNYDDFGSEGEESNLKQIGLVLADGEFTNPLTFTLNDYPHRLDKSIRLKVR